MVACLDNWEDANTASPDYLNECDYMGNGNKPYPPLPMPSGSGCVGMWITDNYGEYIGTCLPEPTILGESYFASFYMGFNNSSTMNNASHTSSSPFKFAIYGASSCSSMPSNSYACLGDLGEWVELTTFDVVGGDSTWVFTSKTFVCPGIFEAIAIGPACDANYTGKDYHFIDDFRLEGPFGTPEELTSISEEGDCINSVILTANHSEARSYQWYLEGVALIGEVNRHLIINYPNNGFYSVLIYTVDGCRISSPTLIDIDPESMVFEATVEDISCFGFQDGSISISNINSQNSPYLYTWEVGDSLNNNYQNLSPGSYSVTVTDVNGCFGIKTYNISEPTILEVLQLATIPPSTNRLCRNSPDWRNTSILY